MTHLDEERLFQLTLGQLDGEAETAARAHLEVCADCHRRHQALSSIVFSRTAVNGTPPGVPTRPDRTQVTAAGLSLERGATLGHYVLLEKLGAGGMGEVFAAFDPRLDRRVALKLLRGGALSLDEGRARLLREAQAMARLQHPNVIAVHDVGTFEDRVFIAMEFVAGDTIAEWLRGERSWREVVDLFRQAGAGLAAAHSAGLVHRDFKPDNVLLGEDGRPRVLDFGLARQSTSTPAPGTAAGDVPDGLGDSPLAQPLTRDGAVMGTPGYMAPEQLAGLATDARSDQFAFCVALYEALYGKRPFGGATLKQHALEMATGTVPGPPAGSQVPTWVHEVLVRGLATDPAQRWPDMNALLAALRPRSERGRGVTLGLVALVLLALVGIGYGVATRQRLMVCGGQERALANLWDKPARERLRQVFARSGFAFQAEAWKGVETTVDAWALDWVATARDACEATLVRKTDSPELLALRRTCLDERLQELRAMVSVLGQLDREVVVNAPFAAKSLQSPLTCLARTRTVVADEQSRQADAALRAHLREAFALFNAGKYEPAAAVLEPALAVPAPAHTLAEGFLLLGRIEHRRHDPHATTLAHQAAMVHALESGEPGLEAMAASRLSADEGPGLTEDEADLFDHLAQAAASRVTDDWEVTVELARNESFLELRRHRDRPALAHLERALTVQREHLPPTHPDLASTLNNIGLALSRLRQFDDAIRTWQQALAIHEQAEGPLHPNTATSAHNLGATLLVVGRAVEARVALGRALEARRQSLGPTDPETLATQLLLARACTALGLLDEASALLVDLRHAHDGEPPSRVLASVVEADAELDLTGRYWKEARARAVELSALASALDDQKLRFSALVLQARAATGLGRWVDAAAALAEAERLQVARDEREQVELDEAHARLDFAQGRFAEARAAWVRAVALREPSSLGRAAHAQALVELARTLVELGQLAEAHARADDAVAVLEGTQFAADAARAKVVLAAVLALEADGGAGASVPEGPALSAVERVALGAWLKAHGLAFRAANDG